MTQSHPPLPLGIQMRKLKMLEMLGYMVPPLSLEGLDERDDLLDKVADGILDGPHGHMRGVYLGDAVHVMAKERLNNLKTQKIPTHVYTNIEDAVFNPPELVQPPITQKEDMALATKPIADGEIFFTQLTNRVKRKRAARAEEAMRANMTVQTHDLTVESRPQPL